MDEHERNKTRFALENHFQQTSSPRFLLGIIVVLTGLTGLLVSHILLHFGEVKMWIRYPCAVAVAYLAFLALLRLWVEVERRRISPGQARHIIRHESPFSAHTPVSSLRSRNKPTIWNWLDLANFADLPAGEGCGVGCLVIFVVTALIGAVAFVISTAPTLLSDVFIDAVLMTALYKRLNTAARQHWLGTAIRGTWIAALVTAIALSIAGALIQNQWPKAKSIGDVFRVL